MTIRLQVFKSFILLTSLVILARLFYWQVINRDALTLAAESQRSTTQLVPADRGNIISSDGYTLVTNQPSYLLYAYLPQLEQPQLTISHQLAPLLIDANPTDATEAAKPLSERISVLESALFSKLTDPDKKWVALQRHLGKSQKENIENLNLLGLGFDQTYVRFYPEASMSAHLFGFVSHDEQGEPKGYFGIEGRYDLELRGRPGKINLDTDAAGRPILIGLFNINPERKGRHLKLHLNRSIQSIVENRLDKGLEKYGAAAGDVIVMDPFTGGILAMASLPKYDPRYFYNYDSSSYKNPVIADTYEPGSTFKVVTMAAAVEENAVTPDTICDSTCDGPVTIGKYTIRTWNDQYQPGETMQQVLERSDNTGMIFTAFELGKEKFVDYISRFGFGQPTGIDLQEESAPPLRDKWGDIDVATASFGQGIAVTGIQMVRAVAAIANGGNLVEPRVVSEVIADQTIPVKPTITRRVISSETARTLTDMMVSATSHGEAQWTFLKDYDIAGKTGTAQVAISGHYDEEKTIASFIGFAPAYDPKFVMLVKLREPTSSPWAAETAAPLWHQIAEDILFELNIPPKHSSN